jgi:hypothetical protein
VRPKLAKGGGEQPGRSKGADPDEDPRRYLVEVGELAASDVDAKKDAGSVLDEAISDGRGANRPAQEQLLTELELQGCHLLRDGGLGVAKLGRGRSERSAADDGEKGAEIAKFHPISMTDLVISNHRWIFCRSAIKMTSCPSTTCR